MSVECVYIGVGGAHRPSVSEFIMHSFWLMHVYNNLMSNECTGIK